MFLVQTKTSAQREIAKRIIEKSGRNDFVLAGDSFVFVENLDELSNVVSNESSLKRSVVLMNTLHIWNASAVEGYLSILSQGFSFIASYELTEHELKDLYLTLPEGVTMLLPIYGRIPLMYTKNCVKKTEGRCNKTSEFVRLKDRKNVYFPVYSDCEKCRNIIYNSVPLSLHNQAANVPGGQVNWQIFQDFYLGFTDEPAETVEAVLNYYLGNISEFPIKNYTTGHFKRSVL